MLSYSMDKLVCLIFIVNFSWVHGIINITELKGPDSVEYGSANEVILDCNFEAEKEKDLEIKWFYNGNTQVIYQWIPDSNKPGQAMGMLKGRVDLDYSVTNDSDTKYRALKIFNVTMDLTGNYTCKVSSFYSEDSETKQLIIYTPAKSGLNLLLLEEDQTLICTVSGVFPKPEINIYLSGDNNTREDIESITVNNTLEYEYDEDSGLFNVTKVHFFPNLTSFTDTVKFVCDLNIPGTDYFLSKSVTYRAEVEIIEYIDEGEYIWNLNDNLTSLEDYSNSTEANSAINHYPGVSLPILVTILFLILCK